jgi:hypothetical protein
LKEGGRKEGRKEGKKEEERTEIVLKYLLVPFSLAALWNWTALGQPSLV